MPATPANQAPAAVLDEQKLRQLYSSMLKCQMLSRIAQKISPSQAMSTGSEAVLAGALAHSRRDDYVVAAQNSVLAQLLHGDPLRSILTQLLSHHADARGPAATTPGQLALTEAMGAAKDLLGSEKAALVFCGADRAAFTFQKEALAMAAKHKAPVICLMETSLSAVEIQAPSRGRKKKSAAPPFPVITVDGADVVAVFRVAQEAVRRARHGQGPSLIQCVMPDHGAEGPLAFMERYLRRKHLWSDEWRETIAGEFAVQLEAALADMQGPSGK